MIYNLKLKKRGKYIKTGHAGEQKWELSSLIKGHEMTFLDPLVIWSSGGKPGSVFFLMITRILLLKKLLVILPFAVVDAGYDYDDFFGSPSRCHRYRGIFWRSSPKECGAGSAHQASRFPLTLSKKVFSVLEHLLRFDHATGILVQVDKKVSIWLCSGKMCLQLRRGNFTKSRRRRTSLLLTRSWSWGL